MKNNKLFSVLIALLVCLTVVVSASATNDDGKADLTISLGSASVNEVLDTAVIKTDDALVVNVNIDNNPGFWYAAVDVVYDNEKLTLDYENGIGLLKKGVSVKAYKENTARVNIGDIYNAIYGEGYFTETGIVATLKFTINEGVDAEADWSTVIKLVHNEKNLSYNKEKDTPIAVTVESLNVNVVGAKHDCSNCETVQTGAIPACQEGAKENDTYCAFCGKLLKEGASIEKTDCNWVETDRTEPTCTKDGSADYKCSLCGATKTEVLPLTGHDFEGAEWVQTKAPTCGDFGVEQRKCNKCDGTEDRRIEATGEHAFEITSTTKAPTCTEKGVNELTCSVCGATKTDDAVPAIGHTEGEWKVTKEATSEAEGEETLYCKTCNEAMQTRAIEKLPEESNNTVLIVVVITVVVLAAAGVAAYFVLKNKKAK